MVENSELPEMSAAIQANVEDVCEAFETAWQHGEEADLAHVLEQVASPQRSLLLRELVAIERHYRSRHLGRAVTNDELLEIHPALRDELSMELSADQGEETQAEADTHSMAKTVDSAITVDDTGGTPFDEFPVEFGRYRLLSRLGTGGMGSVYLAEDTQLERQVALKLPQLGSQSDSQVVDRFYREAKAAATLSHANLCAVYDVGDLDGVHFLTMEYIKGRSLADRLKSGDRFNDRDAVRLIQKIAQALHQAHQRGVVHRDLKPANIMVDPEGEPTVTDFGLAQRRTEDATQITQHGQIIGTPSFMSPEQVDGDLEKIGPLSDVYSLGVVLFVLLTGQRPFQGSTAAVFAQIMTADPPPMNDYRDSVDPGLETLCRRIMARQPEDRYESMEAVARAADVWLQPTDRLIAAPPRSRFAVLMTSFSLISLLLAGMLVIRIQTPEGEVVVNSDVPGVTVDIERDGKPAHSGWRLRQGRNSTTVHTGRVEVTLPKQLQGEYEIEQDEFKLTADGKIVAKIISKPASENIDNQSVELTDKSATSPEFPPASDELSRPPFTELPDKLGDLATGVWVPVLRSASEIQNGSNSVTALEDGVIEIAGMGTAKVSAGVPGGRNMLIRAEIDLIAGHCGGLALKRTDRSDLLKADRMWTKFQLTDSDTTRAGRIRHYSPENPPDVGTDFEDLTIAVIDGKVGVYADGRLIIQRQDVEDVERHPEISVFSFRNEPAKAHFRNVRVMGLDDGWMDKLANWSMDREREIAEWVIEHDGEVVALPVGGDPVGPLSDQSQLPYSPFYVQTIDGLHISANDQLRKTAQLRGLQVLKFRPEGCPEGALRNTPFRSHLKKLLLSMTDVRSSELAECPGLTGLTELTLRDDQVDDWGFLSHLPRLQILKVNGIATRALSQLAESEAFKDSPVRSIRLGSGATVPPSVVACLQSLNPSLSITRWTNGDFEYLGIPVQELALARLVNLGFEVTGTSPRGNGRVISPDQLPARTHNVLSVTFPHGFQITAETVSLLDQVSPVPQMTCDSVSNAHLLVPSLAIRSLKYLNLKNTDLTEQDFETLLKRFRQGTLTIRGTPISEETIRALKPDYPLIKLETDYGIFPVSAPSE